MKPFTKTKLGNWFLNLSQETHALLESESDRESESDHQTGWSCVSYRILVIQIAHYSAQDSPSSVL